MEPNGIKGLFIYQKYDNVVLVTIVGVIAMYSVQPFQWDKIWTVRVVLKSNLRCLEVAYDVGGSKNKVQAEKTNDERRTAQGVRIVRKASLEYNWSSAFEDRHQRRFAHGLCPLC